MATTGKRGIEVLQDPSLNKSTAFTEAEKQARACLQAGIQFHRSSENQNRVRLHPTTNGCSLAKRKVTTLQLEQP